MHSIDSVWGVFEISQIEPSITPILTILMNLDIEGVGACNLFDGTFEIPSGETWANTGFSSSSDDCDYQIHNIFEFAYFDFLQRSGWYEINQDNDGIVLKLFSVNGDEAEFRNYLLDVSDYESIQIRVYPNPSSSIIFIENFSLGFSYETFPNSFLYFGSNIFGHVSNLDFQKPNDGYNILGLEDHIYNHGHGQ